MDLINNVLNIVAPPFIILLLCLYIPLIQLPKSLFSFLLSFFFVEDVAGKVVIITGAASGIGEQLAYEYARRKARLVLADINEESLETVADACLKIGCTDALALTADVTDISDCKRVVDSAVSHFKKLDHLVNNAGISTVGTVEHYVDMSKTRQVMDVNFWGSVYMTHFAIPHLRHTRGKIIVMASASSWAPMPRLSIYGASKAALVAFYNTLRVEVGSSIHITIVTPGYINSNMTRGQKLGEDGRMIIDPNAPSRIFPMAGAEKLAKDIVDSACRGKRGLIEPSWYRVSYWLQTFSPELLEMILRLLYVYRLRGSSPKTSTEMKTD